MLEKSFPLRCIVQLSGRIECVGRGEARSGATRRDASNIREYGDAGAGCSIISTMLARSWGGINRTGTGGHSGGGAPLSSGKGSNQSAANQYARHVRLMPPLFHHIHLIATPSACARNR